MYSTQCANRYEICTTYTHTQTYVSETFIMAFYRMSENTTKLIFMVRVCTAIHSNEIT